MKLASWLQGVVRGTQPNRKSSRRAAARSRSASRLLSAEVLESRLLLSAVSFAPAETFDSGGSNPFSVAVGDFNNDGYIDLAVANLNSGTVGVLLADGDGGFAPPVAFNSGGTSSTSVAVGDFNNDGNTDLAMAVYGFGGSNVSVLLGNGQGGFAAPAIFASGNPAFAVAVGDFNNDGRDDLAVGTINDTSVGVLLATDDVTLFAPVQSFGTGNLAFDNNFTWVAVADFNNDGNPDLAATNNAFDIYDSGIQDTNVGVLLGDGLGGFAPAVTFDTGGSYPFGVQAADFNNDGRADLVVANHESGNVGVLLGNGAGGFAPATTFGTGGLFPRSIAVGDFNNDGQADLAVANQGGNVGVLLGTGLGGFAAPVSFDTGGTVPLSVEAADFDNDGRIDLAVVNYSSANVGVLLNTTPRINTVPGGQVAAEDVAKVISGLGVAEDTVGVLTVTLTVEHGTLTVDSGVADGAGIGGNGTATVTLSGTQAQINATLGAGLTYLGGLNYSGLDTLTMTTTTASGLSDTDAVAIQVLSAQQQADAITAFIADLGDDGVLTGGQENALVQKLSFLSGPNGAAALQAFINQIGGLANAGVLTRQQADDLIASALSILASM